MIEPADNVDSHEQANEERCRFVGWWLGREAMTPGSNDELDWLIWYFFRDQDGHPTNSPVLVAAAKGQSHRIKARIQAMRKAGRLRWHHPGRIHPPRPAHVRAHGWEVIGCPGDGISEDGQFYWAYGCADCLRRVKPDPAGGVIEPPAVVFDECELRIEP
jgi:hypothetical protein